MFIVKKLLIATTIAALCSTSVMAETESRIIDSAIATKLAFSVEDHSKRNVTRQNYSHAESARMFRNWAVRGANEGLTHMRVLAPRGLKAPTVQMNHDSLYSVAISKVVDGKISVELPAGVDVYTAVQIIDEYGHGQHYLVKPGKYTLDLGSEYAFMIFRSGLEKGIEAARLNQDKLTTWGLVSGDYKVRNYDFSEVDTMTAKIRESAKGKVIYYTFPRTEAEVTDRDQWNLENAIGWGGSSPEVNVANLYTNTAMIDGSKCMSTTFDDPKSVYFSSITAYDEDRYLFVDEAVLHVNSNRWEKSDDGTITVSFNCGDNAINNINTIGNDFTFTSRFYGVTQKVIDVSKKEIKSSSANPNLNIVEGTPARQ